MQHEQRVVVKRCGDVMVDGVFAGRVERREGLAGWWWSVGNFMCGASFLRADAVERVVRLYDLERAGRQAAEMEEKPQPAAQARYFLVHTDDYNGHAADFMMRADDPRVGRGYEVKGTGVLLPGRHDAPNGSGRRVRHLRLADGRVFAIYSDWSASELR